MASEITIPGINIEYALEQPKKQLVLVGGGRQPSRDWLQEAAQGRTLWCIDHGVDICHELGMVPERLLGDFDSCHSTSLTWARSKGTTIEQFNPQKDFTDTQAALQMIQNENSLCILTGALGNRFDHTYSTILSFGNSAVKGCVADEQETICFLRDSEALTITTEWEPKAISLLPISEAVTGVTTRGLYWELNGTTLTQTKPYAISNVLVKEQKANPFTISITKGILAVYLCRQEGTK